MRCPREPVAIAVALADKLDMLVGFWAIDEKPTGSKDPYALRRAALGIIRIVLENDLKIGLIDSSTRRRFEWTTRWRFPVKELHDRRTRVSRGGAKKGSGRTPSIFSLLRRSAQGASQGAGRAA